mgnify:CR=1 FL=1
MSEVQNHLGEKFKETIAEAMKTGDFRALNTLVSDTVNDACLLYTSPSPRDS